MMLRHVGLWNRFRPYVYAAREVGTGKVKPAPDVFLHACAEFGVEPSSAVVIEDSVHGAAAAVAAGCRVVGFTGASHTYPGHAEALEAAGAETVISRLADYPAVVEALSSWRG
jgi:beta-phosphoglucomutase-like phosphatase (HAD superfamily)